MSKAGERIIRSGREARAFARGEREGYGVHLPERVDSAGGSVKRPSAPIPAERSGTDRDCDPDKTVDSSNPNS
jgi:hypothetical protein